MDLKTLKLELLERIALIDDEARLLALKRLLDAPRGYGIPNEKLSVVKEGEEAYPRIEDKNYTGAEVRELFEKLQQVMVQEELEMGDDELALLDARRERHFQDEGRSYSVEEVMARLKKDLGE
jgi:hypothetical protein